MKNPTPYLKMCVLGAVEFALGKNQQERIKQVALKTFTDEDGHARRFTWRTIETWFHRYKKWGLTVMNNKTRSDKGKTRKVSQEQLLEAIEQVLPLFHGKNPHRAHLYKACIEKGLLLRENVAPNTFSRLVKELELLKPDSDVQNKRRLAFSKQFANQMWQADTMFGPYVPDEDGKMVQTKLIAFLDDASRVICHGEFFLSENIETMIKALQAAIYKRGVPEQIYVDNGSIYTCKEIILICARLGIILSHTPIRDGSAKGKIERFFRGVRADFLSRKLDLSSLETLNKAFIVWVEDEYNSRTHSTLQMRPIDRFGLDLKRIRFLPPLEANDEIFFVEETRHVKNDNTFSLRNIRFESPTDLRNRQIQVRFDRTHFNKIIVYYKNERSGEARIVDLVGNDRPPRPRQPGNEHNETQPNINK